MEENDDRTRINRKSQFLKIFPLTPMYNRCVAQAKGITMKLFGLCDTPITKEHEQIVLPAGKRHYFFEETSLSVNKKHHFFEETYLPVDREHNFHSL